MTLYKCLSSNHRNIKKTIEGGVTIFIDRPLFTFKDGKIHVLLKRDGTDVLVEDEDLSKNPCLFI